MKRVVAAINKVAAEAKRANARIDKIAEIRRNGTW